MKYLHFVSCFILAASQLSTAIHPPSAGTFNVTLFNPPADTYTIPRTLYARVLTLKQEHPKEHVILATWENYSPEPPYFPIYRSTDLGHTWEHISNITDTVNGWGLRYQPFLYQLSERIGRFKAGTIICAGSSIPADLNFTKIDVYASYDKGYTWEFISSVARGGRAIPNNGETPIWEPFILTWKHQIVLYYADQRDPDHGQKLVHQVSSDLVNWGPLVDDYASPIYDHRPGMTVVAKLPNKVYMMVYEWFGSPVRGFALYYRLSYDPTTFVGNNEPGHLIQSTDGVLPTISPYVVWTPYGGVNGTIVVSANSHEEIFVNTALAAPGSAWRRIVVPAPKSYTRALMVMPDPSEIMILGAGVLLGSNNSVTAYVVELNKIL